MTFLNPAFLWFALFVAVPILVHLFNFRRPRRVLFSNIAFVKEVNKTVVKRIKLKQWLLLALRILAVLGLAFAFANPVILNDSDVAGLQGNKSVIILIDNSNSMTAADERGNYLAQCQTLAQTLIKSYGQADEFQILTTGQLRLGGSFTPASQTLVQLEDLKYRDKPVSYTEIINNLSNYYEEAHNPGRILYFISDFQNSTVLKDTVAEMSIPDQHEVVFLPVGNREQVNVYVTDLAFQDAIIEKNKPATLNLKINNDSDKEITNLSIKVHLEDKVVAISSVNLAAGEAKTAQVTFKVEQGGWQSGYVSIDDTPVEFDNQRYFSFNVPENNKILVVNGGQKSKYVDLLFKNLMSQYEVVNIDQKALANQSLVDITSIVFVGVEDISSGVGEKIKTWVNDGGGFLFFPDETMNTEHINNFYQSLGVGKFGNIATYSNPVDFATPDLNHIIFETVFLPRKANAEFDNPVVTKLYDFQPQNGAIQSTIIHDKNNKPILQETKVGSGTVFTYTLFPGLNWSDFPIKSAFAPILYRSVLLINNMGKQEFSQTLGNFKLKKIKTNSNKMIKLRQKDGFEVIPEQSFQAGNAVLKFDFSEVRAGNYQIIQTDTTLEKISFNYSDEESKLAAPDMGELKSKLSAKGLVKIKVTNATPENVQDFARDGGVGFPLWKYFIMLVALCLFAEVAVLRLIKS